MRWCWGILVAVLAAALAVTGCQTRRTSLIMAGIGGGTALVGGYVTYDARNDDEGPPVIFPLGLLVGGVVLIASVVQAIALGSDDAGDDKSRSVGTPPATPATPTTVPDAEPRAPAP